LVLGKEAFLLLQDGFLLALDVSDQSASVLFNAFEFYLPLYTQVAANLTQLVYFGSKQIQEGFEFSSDAVVILVRHNERHIGGLVFSDVVCAVVQHVHAVHGGVTGVAEEEHILLCGLPFGLGLLRRAECEPVDGEGGGVVALLVAAGGTVEFVLQVRVEGHEGLVGLDVERVFIHLFQTFVAESVAACEEAGNALLLVEFVRTYFT